MISAEAWWEMDGRDWTYGRTDFFREILFQMPLKALTDVQVHDCYLMPKEASSKDFIDEEEVSKTDTPSMQARA